MSGASYTPLLPRELDLSEFKAIQPGKSRRVSVFPDNSTSYTSSSSTADIFFSLPSVKTGYCMSNATQLVFDITVNSTFTTDPIISLSNGNAASVIQAMETIIQNNSVENLLNYNVYANIISDIQPLGRSTCVGTILNGATSTVKAGLKLNGATTVDGVTLRCAIPLYSAVYGAGAEQYAYMCDGARIRLTMAASDVALKYANITGVTAAVYKISNMALQMEIMELDPATHQALVMQSGGVLKLHGMAVNNYQAVVAASTANNILIPARFSSVKGLLTTFRLSANLSAPQIYNVPGDRLNPQVSQYFFTIDGQNVPSVPVRVAASATSVFPGEVLSEVQKVFGGSNQVAFDTVFNQTQFSDLTGVTGTGSFFIGCNFESSDSATNAIISGRDLNSSNVYLSLTHYSTALASVCDTFALYDIVVSYNMADGSVSLSK